MFLSCQSPSYLPHTFSLVPEKAQRQAKDEREARIIELRSLAAKAALGDPHPLAQAALQTCQAERIAISYTYKV